MKSAESAKSQLNQRFLDQIFLFISTVISFKIADQKDFADFAD